MKKSYKCLFCEYKNTNSNKIKIHLVKKHDINPKDSRLIMKNYVCDYC